MKCVDLIKSRGQKEVGGGVDETRLTKSWQMLNLSDGHMGVHFTIFYTGV